MPPPTDPRSYESPRVSVRRFPTNSVRASAHDPYAAFRISAFSYYSLGNLTLVIGRLMLVVAVEWEVYQRTHSATALGLVGLVIVVPVVVLSLPAGHLADRFNRKSIILVTQALSARRSLGLAVVSWQHLSIAAAGHLADGELGAGESRRDLRTPFRLSFRRSLCAVDLSDSVRGALARTFGWAARSSFFPTLVPRNAFANAVTWNSSMFQIGAIAGPAVGGLLLVPFGFPFIYCVDAFCALAFSSSSCRFGAAIRADAWKATRGRASPRAFAFS